MPNRPRRLRDFNYRGRYTYFLTICTKNRQPAFADADFAAFAIAQLLQQTRARGFSILAYCLMPDHVHLLLRGLRENSDLKSFVLSWIARTAYQWKAAHATPLWQGGYYDRVVRDEEPVIALAQYVLRNPGRAGLVADAREYPWSGSLEWSVDEVLAVWLGPEG
jgi:REP-associated tyrosine transposase